MTINKTQRYALLLMFCGLLLSFTYLPTAGVKQPLAQPSQAVQFDVAANPSVIGTGQAVDVTLAAVSTGLTCAEQKFIPMNVAVLVDRSSSMTENDGRQTKKTAAEAAVSAFLSQLDPANDQVALISFAQTAVIDASLGQPEAARAALSSTNIADSDVNGTNIRAGLQLAFDLLQPVVSPDSASVIVLLTDGNQTTGSAEELATIIKPAGIRIISIGLGSQIEENLLRSLASQPSDYYAVPSSDELQAIYESISTNIQQYSPAEDLQVTFVYNPDTFALVEDSVSPMATSEDGKLTWSFSRLDNGRQTMHISLRALQNGKHNIMEKAELTYLQCGETRQTISPTGIFPVTVLEANLGEDTSCIDVQQTTAKGILPTVCGGFPWWPIGLLLGLILFLPFLATANRYDIRAWLRCRQTLPRSFWTGLLLSLSFALLTAAIAQSASQYACNPKAGRLFWRINPSLESAVYLDVQQPPIGIQPVLEPEPEQNCTGCHAASVVGQSLAGVRNAVHGELVEYELDGNPIRLPEVQGTYPAYSPDGTKIAFAANNEDIFILDLQSGQVAALAGASQPGVVESMPTWSPDGKRIAFVRAAGQNQNLTITSPCDILTVPATGGQPLLVPGASSQGFNYHPVYSPDGKWLAFVHHDDGTTTYGELKADIYLVPAVGGAPRRIQANDGSNGQPIPNSANTWPTWSLDSQTVYFSSRRCGSQYDLFAARVGPNGETTTANRLGELSDEQAYEFGLQEVSIKAPSIAGFLFPLIPWGALALAALLLHLLIRPRRSGALEPTVAVRPLPPVPTEGWFDPAQRFKVEMEMIGRPPRERRVENRAVDVVFLLDTSGSMQARMGLFPWQTRLQTVKAAARQCIRCFLSAKQRVAIVGFSNAPVTLQGLTNSESDLLAGLRGLQAGGETAMLAGLKASQDILDANLRRNVQRVVVLFSDGMPTDDEKQVIEQAQAMLAAGIRILVIGTAEANHEFLRQLVKQPEDFYFVRDRSGMFNAFMSVSHTLLRPLAARKVVYSHVYDQSRFQLIENSISPRPSNLQPGLIAWEVEELDQQPYYFEYVVCPVAEGNAPISLAGTVTYDWGGLGIPQTIGTEPGSPVLVKPLPMPPDPPLRQVKPPAQLRAPKPIWQPDHALFIGVGTSGRWILTYLLDNLLNAGSGSLSAGLEFLVVDTNEFQRVQVTQTTNVSFAGVSILPNDVFILDEDLKAPITTWAQKEEMPEEYCDWLKPQELARLDQQLNLANGSFGRRPLVRAALIRHLQKNADVQSVWQAGFGEDKKPLLKDWIKDRAAKVLVDENGKRRVRVFIVGSLAGGMSGVIADIAVLARQVATEIAGPGGGVRVEGYLVGGQPFESLPGSPESRRLRMANSFASLREIGRLQMPHGVTAQLGWEGGRTDQPLFDDWLLFSNKVQAELANSKGQLTNDQNLAEAMLKNMIFPCIADLMSLRLERTTGILQVSDQFNQMLATGTTRQTNEHALMIGSASMFTIRVAVADILRVLHLRWTWEVLKAFLTGEQPLPPDFTRPLPQHSIDFLQGNPNNSDFPGDPSSLVARFLKGGPFSGDAPLPSQALADLLIQQTSPLLDSQALEDALFVGEKQLFDTQLRRFAVAIQHILIGSSDVGSRAARMNYAQRFLESVQSVLMPIYKDLHAAGRQQLALYAEFTMRCAQLQSEALSELRCTISQNEIGRELGLWERLTQRVTLMQGLPEVLDQITCRRYLWGYNSPDVNGSPRFHRFADTWWDKFLHDTVAASLDNLSWQIGSDHKLDIVVRNARGSFGLRQHGMDAFVGELLSIAASFTVDAYSDTGLFDMVLSGPLNEDPQLPNRVGKIVRPMLEMTEPDPGTPPDVLMSAIPESLYNIVNWQHPFAAQLQNQAQQLDQVSVDTRPLVTTNRNWLAFVHLRSSTHLSKTQEWTITKQKYDELDGWNYNLGSFTGYPVELAVFKGEAQGRIIETRTICEDNKYTAMLNYQSSGVLHPFIISALQYPEEARLFALALAAGRIWQKPVGKVMLRVPGQPESEIELLSTSINYIDPLVQALTKWVIHSVSTGDMASYALALKEYYRDENNEPVLALRQWWDHPQPPYDQGSCDRISLGWWVSAVARSWLLSVD